MPGKFNEGVLGGMKGGEPPAILGNPIVPIAGILYEAREIV